jgi:hypothetical protein
MIATTKLRWLVKQNTVTAAEVARFATDNFVSMALAKCHLENRSKWPVLQQWHDVESGQEAAELQAGGRRVAGRRHMARRRNRCRTGGTTDMITFRERKAERTGYFLRFVFGWKLRVCTACNGSGHYDNDGSPACDECDGSGRARYRGPKDIAANKGKT